MTNSSRIVGICVVAAGWACGAAAEELSAFGVGSRVRVTFSTLPSRRLVGTLTGIDEDSLAVQAKDMSEALVFERESVQRFEWSVRPSRKKKGALLGLAVGFGVGLAGTFILCDAYGTSCPTAEGFVFGSLYGAAVGAFGAGVGALVAPGERWAEVSLERLPKGAHPTPHARFQLSVVPMMGARRGVTVVASFP